MNMHADKSQENKSQPVVNRVSQKQSSEVAAFPFVDNRSEAVTQRKLQELANNSPQVKQAAQLQAMPNNYVIQKRDRKAEVAWDVTHEVFPDKNESLFGDDSNPFKNEGMELYRGDKLIVDDEAIFQSRRGANQEISNRRKSDREGHLTNKWLKLKDVNGKTTSGDGYVREETIRIAKDIDDKRKIDITQVNTETAKGESDKIHSSWKTSKKNRRMSLGAWKRWEKVRKKNDKDSSPSWDQIAEGYDVSKELSNSPKVEGSYEEYEKNSNQAIFTAYDRETSAPIGIIVIEKRTTQNFPLYNKDDNKKWYLRWLIGHPTLKGAGGLLLDEALNYVRQQSGTAVWVQSAPSAVKWYQSKGFNPLEEEQQKELNPDFEEGWDSLLMVLDLE